MTPGSARPPASGVASALCRDPFVLTFIALVVVATFPHHQTF